LIMALILCRQNVGKPADMGHRRGRAAAGSPGVGGRAETPVDFGIRDLPGVPTIRLGVDEMSREKHRRRLPGGLRKPTSEGVAADRSAP
jgi:hypothetical protein